MRAFDLATPARESTQGKEFTAPRGTMCHGKNHTKQDKTDSQLHSILGESRAVVIEMFLYVELDSWIRALPGNCNIQTRLSYPRLVRILHTYDQRHWFNTE